MSRRPSATSLPRPRCGPRSRWRFVRSRETPEWASSFVVPSKAGAGPWRKTSACVCASPGQPWIGSGSTTSWPPSSPDRAPTSRVGWPCGRAWSARHGPRSARLVGSVPTRPGSRASSRPPRSSAPSWTHCGPPSPPPPWCATCCRPANSWSGTPPACSPRTSGSCFSGAGARPSSPPPGAPTISPCWTRPPSSREVGPARMGTSSWTRPRT